jgi:hypothetical protein
MNLMTQIKIIKRKRQLMIGIAFRIQSSVCKQKGGDALRFENENNKSSGENTQL